MPISHVSEKKVIQKFQTRTFEGDYHLNENDEYMKKSRKLPERL